MPDRKNYLIRDLGIIIISVLVAINLVQSGALESLLTSSQESRIIGSFFGGMFLVSVFTAAPAFVALTEIAQANSIWLVAFFGGIGALIGDLLIFRFVKDTLADDILYLIQKTKSKRLFHIFRLKIFGWLIPFLGALIVASPLPDEIGLAMMGISKMKTALFVPTIFVLDFLGILALATIAKSFLSF